MKVDKDLLESVEQKLNQQNALKAAILVSFWSFPILIAWYYLFHAFGNIAPILLFVSGAGTGLAVRIHGKGYTPLFSILAVMAHALVVFSAFALDIFLAPGEQIWAIFLLGLYIGGAWIAAFIARKHIPFDEQRAFTQLSELNEHPSKKRLRNRWFISLPLTVLCTGFLLWTTLAFLYAYGIISSEHKKIAEQEQRVQKFEKQAIDVSRSNLTGLSNKEALLYVYAFHSGVLYNDKARQIGTYPISQYKSQTILKFLIEERNLARAKFILGIINFETNGLQLINQASNDGDQFAKLFTAAQLGCFRPKEAEDLLDRFYQTAPDNIIRQTAYSYISEGFDEICARNYQPSFLLKYVSVFE